MVGGGGAATKREREGGREIREERGGGRDRQRKRDGERYRKRGRAGWVAAALLKGDRQDVEVWRLRRNCPT